MQASAQESTDQDHDEQPGDDGQGQDEAVHDGPGVRVAHVPGIAKTVSKTFCYRNT